MLGGMGSIRYGACVNQGDVLAVRGPFRREDVELCREPGDGDRRLGGVPGCRERLELERDEVACAAGSAKFGTEAQARETQFRLGQVGDRRQRGALLGEDTPRSQSLRRRKADGRSWQGVYQLDYDLGWRLVLQLR